MSSDCKYLGEDRANFGGRAVSALFKTDKMPDQPGSYDIWEYNGRRYVVLGGGRSDSGIVAMYRIKNDGILRRLKRYPSCIADEYKKS